MPKGPTGQRRPSDVIDATIKVAKIATGEVADETMSVKEYAQKGEIKGRKVRAQRLSPEKRQEIAQKAARARWGEKGTLAQ